MSSEQIRQRRANLDAVVALGVDPYPYSYDATHHAADVLDRFDTLVAEAAQVNLAGRVITSRGHGKSTFVHLQDISGRIQVYFKINVVGEEAYEVVRLLDLGDLIGVRGTLFTTRTGEKTVEAHDLTLLAKCLRPLPEKWHGLRDTEIRYRQRYLDLIVTEDARRVFKTRTALVSSVRRFLDDRGFLEVETPVLQPIYGGAFATPFVTRHEALDMKLYLRISDELYLKRLIVGGMERVYEIARDFRNEGIDRNHNPEFTMLEFYQAYADYHQMMDATEELVAGAIHQATGGYQTVFRGQTLDFTPPWRRVRYFDAVREATGVDLLEADETLLKATAHRLRIDVTDKVGTGQLVDAIFSESVEPNLIQPTFLMDFPREMSPLARAHRDDPRVVERFEVFVGGMELANAFSEQNDPAAQEAAFDLQTTLRDAGDREAQVKDWDYLRALQFGMPPTGGVGIGIDRLTMLATGMENIREVILFPQLRAEEGLGEPGEDAESEDGADPGDAPA